MARSTARAATTLDKGVAAKATSSVHRIEAATIKRTQVTLTERMLMDSEALFAYHSQENAQLLPRGALTEMLRDIGLEAKLGDDFRASARLAFDAHSGDSHFLTLPEFKQLYYMISMRHPGLLPRASSLSITIVRARGLPPADMAGKSDPFCTVQISGKPRSKSQTVHADKTLDPVWGEEFYDKYAYEEGDSLDFAVVNYERGARESDVLGKAKLPSSKFHREGGFDDELRLTVPPEFGRYTPTLRVRVVVDAIEKAAAEARAVAEAAAAEAANRANGSFTCSHQRMQAAFSLYAPEAAAKLAIAGASTAAAVELMTTVGEGSEAGDAQD